MKKYTKLPIIVSLFAACAFGALFQNFASVRSASADEDKSLKSEVAVESGKSRIMRVEMNGAMIDVAVSKKANVHVYADEPGFNDRTALAECKGNVRLLIIKEGKVTFALKSDKVAFKTFTPASFTRNPKHSEN